MSGARKIEVNATSLFHIEISLNTKTTTKIKILHVDDDPCILQVSKDILEMEGNFEVDSALSVDEAVKKLEEQSYDAVISDYEMPQKNGLQFLKELRQQKNEIPFILFTGKGREEVAIKALNLGADGYMNKQGDPETTYGELSHDIKLIVEHNKAKKELRERDIRLTKLASQTPGMLYQFMRRPDGTYRVPFTSDTIRNIFGCSPQDVREDFSPIARVIVPEDLDNVIRSIEHSAAHMTPWQCEYRVQLPGQQIRWLWGQSVPERLGDGSIIWTGYNADITERKLMDVALRKSNERFKQVMEHVEEFVWEVDAAGVYTYVSSVVEKMLGFKPEEVVGKKRFYDFFHPDDEEELKKKAFSVLDKKDSFKGLINRNVARNGSIVWLSTSGVPIVADDGRLLGYRGVDVNITERKKAEEASRTSEAKYRELINGMNDTIWVMDFDANLVDVNDAAVKILGYSREELLSMGPPDIDNSLTAEKIRGLIKRMPADKIQVFETTHTTKDGKTIPVEISSSLVTYQGKQAILSIARDITDRKKVDEALRESEEKYRTQFEEAMDGIVLVDAETGIIVDCNRALAKLVGRPKSELVGKHQRTLHPPEETEGEFSRTFKQHLKEKEGQVLEAQVITKNGELRDVAIKANAFELAGRRVLQGIFRDITEQKKVEIALREAEEKYRETIVNANVGIIAYDPKGEVTILNPKMEEMTGFTSRDIPTLTKWFEKLYPNEEERRKVRDKWFKRMSEEGEVKEGHAIITTKEGKRRNFLFNGFQLKSGDFIAFAQDITERKEAEEKLDKLMNELVMVNEKLNVVGSLTRHDVGNKLCAVTGNAFLLKKRHGDQADIMDGLSKMEQAVKGSMKIFEFAKMYEQLGVEELKYVDAEKTINEAGALFSGLNFKVVNDCHGLSLLADSFLRQMFFNFIDNTRKYGKKTTAIRVYYEKAEQGELRLIYEDDGVGISAKDKLKLFMEGFSTGGSTGFGLFFIKKMMDIYGWKIQETGEPGKGAKFTLTIPRINQSGKESFQIIL